MSNEIFQHCSFSLSCISKEPPAASFAGCYLPAKNCQRQLSQMKTYRSSDLQYIADHDEYDRKLQPVPLRHLSRAWRLQFSYVLQQFLLSGQYCWKKIYGLSQLHPLAFQAVYRESHFRKVNRYSHQTVDLPLKFQILHLHFQKLLSMNTGNQYLCQ